MADLQPVAVAIGSNLGDRQAHLRACAQALRACTLLQDVRFSTVYEAPAVPVPGQARASGGAYLNAAMVGATRAGAHELLGALLAIERALGRDRSLQAHGQARVIDLDLLLVAEQVVSDDSLMLPHPRLHERLFVLEPLAELAGDWYVPVRGQSVRALRNLRRAAESPWMHPDDAVRPAPGALRTMLA
jgi:2-amino-4-hydroxy-6-hydroxymethyldihydropteridine diphosphokinase